MDFNYFIRALMDVRSATAISAGPLATAFYTRSLSFAGFLESVNEWWVEIDRDFVKSHVCLVCVAELRTKVKGIREGMWMWRAPKPHSSFP